MQLIVNTKCIYKLFMTWPIQFGSVRLAVTEFAIQMCEPGPENRERPPKVLRCHPARSCGRVLPVLRDTRAISLAASFTHEFSGAL